MKPPSLLLLGLDAHARLAVIEASRVIFPDATIFDAATVAEAETHDSGGGVRLLVVGEMAPAALRRAIDATDEFGLRRWALVVCGAPPDFATGLAAVVPESDWQAHRLATVFQSAIRVHTLERDNARLRGDLSTLARRINHDLRSPVTAIGTACEAINENLADSAVDNAAFTQSIAACTDELMRLTDRVGLILRASAETVAAEPLAMGDIVFGTLQRMESPILRLSASITQPGPWPDVRGVAPWLDAIWFNLISNALQHSVKSPQVELGWSEAQGEFHFWVNDAGPGVPSERVAELFYPFHLLHRLNAPRGLGLPLVQRLVELQDGRCGYAPRPGGGAHFYFTLPARLPA